MLDAGTKNLNEQPGPAIQNKANVVVQDKGNPAAQEQGAQAGRHMSCQTGSQTPRQASRMTRQRALVLAELRSVTSHPTADEIYAMVRRKLPHISLGTVYRNLDLLAATNEILCLEYAGFQKRFDGNVQDHQHVRCVHCGRVADVRCDVPTPALPENMRVPDFTVFSARVEFFGMCDECQQAEQAALI